MNIKNIDDRVIDIILRNRERGVTLANTAQELNANGLSMPRGGKFTTQVVSNIAIHLGKRATKRATSPMTLSDEKQERRALLELVIVSKLSKRSKLKLIESLLD